MSADPWHRELRDLERTADTFLARTPTAENGRLFGGLVAAQALSAAAATASPDKVPHSLHSFFLRSGQPQIDIEFDVARLRDGNSFETRRVTATQAGHAIFEAVASFHAPEPGDDSHPATPPFIDVRRASSVALPSELASRLEIRVTDEGANFTGPPYWVRSLGGVEDDPITRACVLTYISDLGLMLAARPLDVSLDFAPDKVRNIMRVAASLDHTVWFHRPFHPDRWHCYQTTRLNNVSARGLALGCFYDDGGVLIATTAQEALWRVSV